MFLLSVKLVVPSLAQWSHLSHYLRMVVCVLLVLMLLRREVS